jgi:hypothetical protein
MRLRSPRSLIALLVVPFLGLGSVALVASSAQAAQVCATSTPAATLIAPGICEVRMTTSGTFTPPSGVSKVASVIVGAGGGSGALGATGAGGGAVVYVDSVPTGAPLAVTVGSGGAAFVVGVGALDGGESSVGPAIAPGGHASGFSLGGQSGTPHTSSWNDSQCTLPGTETIKTSGGSGAQASNDPTVWDGGLGFAFSELPAVDLTLFPVTPGETVYGSGGSACQYPLIALPLNTGAGGGGNEADWDGQPGSDGLVVFRFASTLSPDPTPTPSPSSATPSPAATDSAALPTTGTSSPSSDGPLIAVALGLAGLALLGLSLRIARRRG